MLVPHIFFPPHTGGKFMRRRATQQRRFPALPRLWIPITPCEYVTMHMETHMHMNIWIYACECMHTRTRSFTRRLWHFAFPQQEAPRSSSGTEGWAARRAEERQQGSCCGVTMTPHAAHCRVRGSERISWGWRGQNTGDDTDLALQVLYIPKINLLPAPFWRDLHSLTGCANLSCSKDDHA